MELTITEGGSPEKNGIAKRKSINEMSEEEKEVQRHKWRERQRRFRIKRGLIQNPDENPIVTATLALTGHRKRLPYGMYLGLSAEARRRTNSKTIRKKSITEMSEDEKEIQRQQWRERQRFSRLRRGGQFLDEETATAIAMTMNSELWHRKSVRNSANTCDFSLLLEPETITPDISITAQDSSNSATTIDSSVTEVSAASLCTPRIKRENMCCEKCLDRLKNTTTEVETTSAKDGDRVTHCCESCFVALATQDQACLADLPETAAESINPDVTVAACQTEIDTDDDEEDNFDPTPMNKNELSQCSTTAHASDMVIITANQDTVSNPADPEVKEGSTGNRLHPVPIKNEICCEKCFALCSNQEQACMTIQSLQKQIQLLEEELHIRRNGKCS